MPDVLLRFLHISDTHYSPDSYQRPPSRHDTRHATQSLINHLNALPYVPDLIVHTGDVAYDPVPDIYDEIKPLFAQLNAPLLMIPGNHDHSATLQTVLMERETVDYPLYYETEKNGVRLICMDSNGPDAKPPQGQVTPEQIEWLQMRLALDDPRPIVVFIHHPLLKTGTSAWYDKYMITENGEAVHAALVPAADRIRGVFFGHVHHHISFHRDGIFYSAVKSSWTQFHIYPEQKKETLNNLDADPGYALVTITTEGTFVQRYSYRLDAD